MAGAVRSLWLGTGLVASGMLFAALSCSIVRAADSSTTTSDGLKIIDRIRVFPAAKHETDLVGGKFLGSNTDTENNFVELAEIKDAPAPGTWSEVHIDVNRPFRFIRYESPPGSHCRVAEIQFYSGDQIIKGSEFSSVAVDEPPGLARNAFDGKTETVSQSKAADGQYVGMDLWGYAACKKPAMIPAPAHFDGMQKVTLSSGTAGAIIRFTTDGTTPSADKGQIYTKPLDITQSTCLQAIASKEGIADSVANFGVYQIGAPHANWQTLHVGNSLTGSTHDFPLFASTIGIEENYKSFLHGGATTKTLWTDATGERRGEWDKDLQSFKNLDHFTLQPRDFNAEQEADYDLRFINVVRDKFPSMQPWLYAEWVEFDRHRPTDKGTQPTSQMTKVWPALTWEESMSAMILYVEDLQSKLAEKDRAHPPPKIIPAALTMGWIHRLIEEGKVAGMPPGSFHRFLFHDAVHPNQDGCYLVDLTWLCAFSGNSVENACPLGTKLTAKQAQIMQNLSWDVVKNYPASGLYEEGTRKVARPLLHIAKRDDEKEVTTAQLSSKTRGAWFRYTLDGTEPSRTRGYVYCGVISLRPGMKLKAIAYKSGMVDSPAVSLKWQRAL